MAGDAELLSIVESKVGALSPDEGAVFHGMVTAAEALGVEPSPFDARAAGEVFYAFRFRPCPFCGKGLGDHALDLDRPGVVVRCRIDGGTRPVPEWLAGPVRAGSPPGGIPLAVALWVGIPLISCSFLVWLMPVVAAAMLRTRRWVTAAVGWLALTFLVFAVVLPRVPLEEDAELGVWDALLAGFWLAGIVWGIFQVKPWLAVLAARRRR